MLKKFNIFIFLVLISLNLVSALPTQMTIETGDYWCLNKENELKIHLDEFVELDAIKIGIVENFTYTQGAIYIKDETYVNIITLPEEIEFEEIYLLVVAKKDDVILDTSKKIEIRKCKELSEDKKEQLSKIEDFFVNNWKMIIGFLSIALIFIFFIELTKILRSNRKIYKSH
jgi:hypothetical protein